MGIFDRIKESATGFANENQISEKFGKAKEKVQQSWSEGTASFRQDNAECKEMKKPLEGSIIRYEVIYIGGLPEYPKRKSGAIGMNIMQDRFSFRMTRTTREWFQDFDIFYSQIKELHIEKRTITNAEMLMGGGNDANQQQENNICITFVSTKGLELMLRVEMLTGTTIFAQAEKCRQFMDILRQNCILQKLGGAKMMEKQDPEPAANHSEDIIGQIEKLASLYKAGILSEEEFSKKKEELLARL